MDELKQVMDSILQFYLCSFSDSGDSIKERLVRKQLRDKRNPLELPSKEISNLIKYYSKEAAFFGQQCDRRPQKIIVILNPAANKKKTEKNFKKYCEPIFHLAGFMVDLVKTDSEGHAEDFIEKLNILPSAVIVAGGDGTVSEVLTGIMRRNCDRCPIAILPLGVHNDIAKKYLNLSFSSKLNEVESLITASMNVVRGCLKERSVMKIEQISDAENDTKKPIYALGYLKWGINQDITSLQEKYWYFGTAKKYCSAIINAFNRNLTWSCKADVCYSLPCPGCSNCIHSDDRSNMKRLSWTSFLFKGSIQNNKKRIDNNDCKKEYNDKIESSNVCIYVDDSSGQSKIVLERKEKVKPGYDFLHKYFTQSNENNICKYIQFRKMTLLPNEICKGSSKYYFIDNEVFEVRPINLILLPNAVQLYS